MNEPVKCPDCAAWWRGDEHRCPPPASDNTVGRVVSGFTVTCTCVLDPFGQRLPTTMACPVHDVWWSTTSMDTTHWKLS